MKAKHFFASILILVCLLFQSIPMNTAQAAGTTRYVSNAGDDLDFSCADRAHPCTSIQGALDAASAGDTIRVATGTYTYPTTPDFYVVKVQKNITISGGWNASFKVQTGASVIDGQGSNRGIWVNKANITVILERLVIKNSLSYQGAGIFVSGATVTLRNSALLDNASSTGSGIGSGGGGIYLAGGNLTVINTTISGNTTGQDSHGAGIYVQTGTLNLQYSTVVYNDSQGYGGGIFNWAGVVNMTDTILALNTSSASYGGPNCYGTINTSSYNIVSDTTACTIIAGTGDQFGDQFNPIDPLIVAALSGPVPAHRLMNQDDPPLKSPAIDAADPAFCPATDAWGKPRPAPCDIGAYEYLASSVLAFGGSGQYKSIYASDLSFDEPLTALVIDSTGAPIPSVTVTFTAPDSGASGTFPSGTVTTVDTDENGIATTDVFTANTTAGAYMVDGTIVDGATIAHFDLENYVPVATTIVPYSGTPQHKPPLTAYASLRALVTDQHEYPMSGVTVTFTAPDAGASGTFATYVDSTPYITTADTNASGIATASTYTANGTEGRYSVFASAAGIATSAEFKLKNFTAIATTLEIAGGDGQSATPSTSFKSPLRVLVKDQDGDPMDGVSVVFAAPVSGASGIFSTHDTGKTYQTTVGPTLLDGIATTSTFTANATLGTNYSVRAYATTGVAPDVYFSLTNSNPVATAITVNSGSPQSVVTGRAFPALLTAIVKDQRGDPMYNQSITFTVVPDGGTGAGATFASSSPVNTDMYGVAVASGLTANAIAGTYVVTASSGALTPAQFQLTNVLRKATTLKVSSGSPQSALVRTPFTNPLVVSVKDQVGDPISGVTVTFTAPASGASGVFTGTGTNVTTAVTDGSGIATAATFTANNTAGGPYTVNANAAGTSSTARFQFTNQPRVATTITVTSGSPQSTAPDTMFPSALQVSVEDQIGDPLPGVTVTYTPPASGASGTFAGDINTAVTDISGIATSVSFTANSNSGAYMVDATVAGIASPAQFQLANLSNVPTTIAVSSGSPQIALVNAGYASPLKVLVSDQFAAPLPGVTVTFTAPASGASGTFAGGVTTAVTDGSGIATAATFTANGTTGFFTVHAAVSGIATTADFSLGNRRATPSFSDVPYTYSETLGGVSYPLYSYIQALYDAGYTGGCLTTPTLQYCPTKSMNRAESSVFMLRGVFGGGYGTSAMPGTPPASVGRFKDNWSGSVAWASGWAEGMWQAGLTAGCKTSPQLLFCPADTFPRVQAAVFGLRLKYGKDYGTTAMPGTPPAVTVNPFGDDWSSSSISWGLPWAVKAYQDGLIVACGSSGGKPLFCPTLALNRAWAAYMVVQAKGLPLSP